MSVGRLRVLVLSDPVVQFPVFVFVMEAASNDHNPSVIRKYKDDTNIQVPHTDNIDDLLKALLDAVRVIQWPECSTRRSVSECYHGFVLGLVSDRYRCVKCMSQQNHGHDNRLMKLLCKTLLAAKHCKQLRYDFTFTSIQCNKNLCAKEHRDENNEGPSAIVKIGPTKTFLGVKNGAGNIDMIDCWNRFAEFDGTNLHKTEMMGRSCEYEHYSFVFYVVKDWTSANPVDITRLRSWGCSIPSSVDFMSSHLRNEVFPVESSNHGMPASDIINNLRHRLVYGSALWGTSQSTHLEFGGLNVSHIVLFGNCQGGKSFEICRAAWLAHFVYKTVPVVFVKVSGGISAMEQLKLTIARFNKHIDEVLLAASTPPDEYGCGYARYHLWPVRMEEFNFHKRYECQVVISICNPSSLRLFLRLEMESCIQASASVAIFDEDDLNIQTDSADRRATEKLLFEKLPGAHSPLRERFFQVISVTATISALVLTGRYPVRACKMPDHPTYRGLQSCEWHLLDAAAFEDTSDRKLPGGVVNMVDDMLGTCSANIAARVALLHMNKVIVHHKKLQSDLLLHYKTRPLLVITHNSGGQVKTNAAHTGLTLGVTAHMKHQVSAFMWQWQGAREKQCSPGCPLIIGFDRVRGHVSKERSAIGTPCSIQRLLTYCHNIIQIEQKANRANPVVLIISGHQGGRATSFVSETGELHLSDLLMRQRHVEATHGEHLIQEASRICGKYREGVPLTMWCTKDTKECILEQLELMNELQDVLLQRSPCVPVDIIESEGFKDRLVKFNRPLKLTRQAVQRGWSMKKKHKRLVQYDAGKLQTAEYGGGVVPMHMLPTGANPDILNEHSHMDVLRTVAEEVFGSDCPVVHLLDEVHKKSWRITGKTTVRKSMWIKPHMQLLKTQLNIGRIIKMASVVNHQKFAAASFRVFHGHHFTDKRKNYCSYATWKFANYSGVRVIVRRRVPQSAWQIGSVHFWRTWNRANDKIDLIAGRITTPGGITIARTR